MPIPLNQVLTAQILVKANLAAAGGQAKNVQTTFTYRRQATTVAPTKAALVTAFAAGPYAAMLAAFNVGYENGSAWVRWLEDADNPTTTISLAGVGAIATDRAPSYNAVYMLLRTGVRGRKYRSSRHFPAVNEIDTTGDVLTGAGLVRWQAVQTALLANLTDATGNVWVPCVVSASLSQLRTNPTTVVRNDVTEVILDLTLGTMRKRKVRTVI